MKLIKDSRAGGKDRYGRLLRYVKDGRVDVGRRQVTRGWARVLLIGDGFKRAKKYRRKQRAAKRQDRGVWGKCGRFPG